MRRLKISYIDREEAVKKIKEAFALGDCYCDEPAITGLLNVITPWRLTEDEPPDTDVEVIVTDGVYTWVDELQDDIEDGQRVIWWDSQSGYGDVYETAWMPMPETPNINLLRVLKDGC